MNKFERQTIIAIILTALASAGVVFFAAVLAVFIATPASSQTPNTATKESRCVSTIQHQANVQERIRGKPYLVTRMRVLRFGAARRFMAALNSMPPQSSIQADTVGVIVVAGAPVVWVTFAIRNCITGEAQLPVPTYLRLLDESGNRLGDA